MLRPERLRPPRGRITARQAVVGHVVEGLQEPDGDDGAHGDEGQRPQADHAEADCQQGLQREVAEHTVAGTDRAAARAPQPLRLEAPGLTELACDRARQEGVESLAQPRAGGILPGGRPAMMAVHVGDPEVHVEDAAQQREAERALRRRAAVDHVVGGDEAEHAEGDAGGDRQARGLGKARPRPRGQRRGPGEGGDLQRDVEPEDQPMPGSRACARGRPLVAEHGVEAGQDQRRGDHRGEGPGAAQPAPERQQGQEAERRAVPQRRHAALAQHRSP
nr:hypothetical protein [Phenylobacterium sp.]